MLTQLCQIMASTADNSLLHCLILTIGSTVTFRDFNKSAPDENTSK